MVGSPASLPAFLNWQSLPFCYYPLRNTLSNNLIRKITRPNYCLVSIDGVATWQNKDFLNFTNSIGKANPSTLFSSLLLWHLRLPLQSRKHQERNSLGRWSLSASQLFLGGLVSTVGVKICCGSKPQFLQIIVYSNWKAAFILTSLHILNYCRRRKKASREPSKKILRAQSFMVNGNFVYWFSGEYSL